MMSSSGPVGNYESRHVSQVREGDLVWCPNALRWRRVTSVFCYTTEIQRVDMLKLVFDLTVFVRHTLSGDARYDVLTDEVPHPGVAPQSATSRRRGRDSSESDDTRPTPSSEAQSAAQSTLLTPAGTVTHSGDFRARREALRYSRAKFAELCGLTPGALWRVEDGRPKDDESQRVEDALKKCEAGKTS